MAVWMSIATRCGPLPVPIAALFQPQRLAAHSVCRLPDSLQAAGIAVDGTPDSTWCGGPLQFGSATDEQSFVCAASVGRLFLIVRVSMFALPVGSHGSALDMAAQQQPTTPSQGW